MKKLVRHGAVWIDDAGFLYEWDELQMLFRRGDKAYEIVKRYGDDMVIAEELRR